MHFTIDDFIAGWIGGICGLFIGHPLDTLKVRQQAYGGNLFVTAKRTFKYEGLRGFYKGMLFPLLIVGPSNAIFFGVYGNVMKLQEETEKRMHKISVSDNQSMKHVYVAGCVAGFFQVLFTSPVEFIKTILQAKTGGRGSWRKHYEVPYNGPFDAIAGIWKDRGLLGFFQGCGTMMWRDVPTSGLYTLTYEMLLYSNFSQCETPALVKQMVAGGTAGVMSWVTVIPLDVVKSRIQTDNPHHPLYRGILDCFYKTYKTEGFRIFFKGSPAIILRAFPVNAAIFMGYEAVVSVLL